MAKKASNDIERLKVDFIAFLFVLWKALGLPPPTRIQIAMARTLANQTGDRFILQGFRGVAKSYITCAYAVWRMWNNPQLKILIVSANGAKAGENATFIKQIINLLPFLNHLKPARGQRDQSELWDVAPATPSPSPSFKSVGIYGQVTGSRADIIIADDVEIPSNSATDNLRSKLLAAVQEFEALLKPEAHARIIYLGTPQTEMTLYKTLEDEYGFSTIIYPVRYPRSADERNYYGSRLAPLLASELTTNPLLMGRPTDPDRFDEAEILKREIGYGKAGFTLQFMLNPNLSDAEKYPLRLRDLIVCSLDRKQAPMQFSWMPNRNNKLGDNIPMVGLRGDAYHTYESISPNMDKYLSKILVIDPSGRGKDETGWCILYTLNGYIFGMAGGGLKGGYADDNLLYLARKAKEWQCTDVVIESNFGDGMFTKLFEPVLLRERKCALHEVRSSGQKEKRIADTLEPLMGSHRLIINDEWVQTDYVDAVDHEGKPSIIYSLFYQMTRLTRDRGALGHDDRIDALAIGCAWLVEQMAQDAAKGENDAVENWLEEEMTRRVEYLTGSLSGVGIAITDSYEDDDDFGGLSMFD